LVIIQLGLGNSCLGLRLICSGETATHSFFSIILIWIVIFGPRLLIRLGIFIVWGIPICGITIKCPPILFVHQNECLWFTYKCQWLFNRYFSKSTWHLHERFYCKVNSSNSIFVEAWALPNEIHLVHDLGTKNIVF
jgi:hypothetical protein